MEFFRRYLIQLRKDIESSRLEAVVGNHYNVSYVVRIIIRGIFHIIRVVVDPRSKMVKRRI